MNRIKDRPSAKIKRMSERMNGLNEENQLPLKNQEYSACNSRYMTTSSCKTMFSVWAFHFSKESSLFNPNE